MRSGKILTYNAIFLSVCGLASAGDVTLSGFMSAGAGKIQDDSVTDSKVSSYAGYGEEDLTFNSDSVVGLQARAQINDKLSATVQFTSRGTEDYKTEAEWAYVSYDVNDSFTWRVGRLRSPFYQYSDYLDVGYAMPWIRAPREVYFLSNNSVNAIDTLWRSSFGSTDSTVQIYTGSFDDVTNTGLPVKSRSQTGIVWSLSHGAWSGRVAHHQADLTIDVTANPQIAALIGGLQLMGNLGPLSYDASSNIEELTVIEDKAVYRNIALNYDGGNLVFGAEVSTFSLDSSPYGDIKRSYAMVGWRIKDVLIHFTSSQADDDVRTDLGDGIPTYTSPPLTAQQAAQLNAVRPGLNAVADSLVSDDLQTSTIGLRWDFTSSAAFKFQIDKPKNKITDEDQTLISFAIQTVF